MSIDAMKAVLELLESDSPAKVHLARGALRAAIERAEKRELTVKDCLTTEQPVAWMVDSTVFTRWQGAHLFAQTLNKTVIPLYTAPPQRRPSDSFVAWNNTQCNPLAPAEKQNLSAWEDGYASGVEAEREACRRAFDAYLLTSDPGPLRARGEKK